MADNTTLDAMSGGDTIAADDIGGVKYQRVKLEWGPDGTVNEVDDASGKRVPVNPTFPSTLIQVASAGLTTATTAYTADDQLGTILTFASAVRASGGTGIIQSATLLDKAKIIGAVDLFLFDRSVTLASDNAAASFSDADMLFCLGVLQFRGPIPNAANFISVLGGQGIMIKPNVTSLFGALVTRAGHTFFGAVGDLVVTLGISQD